MVSALIAFLNFQVKNDSTITTEFLQEDKIIRNKIFKSYVRAVFVSIFKIKHPAFNKSNKRGLDSS